MISNYANQQTIRILTTAYCKRWGTSIDNKDDFITAMMCMNVLATEYVMCLTYDMVGPELLLTYIVWFRSHLLNSMH